MDQKSQNEKKRHHYIPITYLDKFADDTGKVMAYRKDEVLKPLHVRPSAIAFERYYYSQPLPEGGQDNNTLEDLHLRIFSAPLKAHGLLWLIGCIQVRPSVPIWKLFTPSWVL